ncbi:MAG: hypothetical protein WBE69_05105 [Candidatus Binataceae bacterium]
MRFDACLIIPGQHGFRGFDLLCDTRRSGFDVNYGGVIGIHQAVLNGNFLFDFRTSNLSIDRTALLGKVLVDFVPHGSQKCGERPVSRLAGSRRLKMLFFTIDFGDTSPCVPGAVIEICSALQSLYPVGAGSIVIFRSMAANSWRVR